MIDFRFLHYILPGLPMSKEKRAALEVMTALKGGEGSGNFGHAGRPGEVGGSAGGGESVVSSRDEVIEWSKDSAITEALYHGTSETAAESIRQNGFRIGSGEQGRLLGRGVYFTEKISDASKFGDVLEVRVNVSKVHRTTLSEWVNLRRAMDSDMENSGLGLSKVDTINWWAKNNNIDAVVITDRMPQVIIFDPSNIKVVK